MSLQIDVVKKTDEEFLFLNRTTKHMRDISIFLMENQGTAFSTSEITEMLEGDRKKEWTKNPNSLNKNVILLPLVSSSLHKLRRNKKSNILKKGSYFWYEEEK